MRPMSLDYRVEEFFRSSGSPLQAVYHVSVEHFHPDKIAHSSISTLLRSPNILRQPGVSYLGSRTSAGHPGHTMDVCATVRSESCTEFLSRISSAWAASMALPAAAAASGGAAAAAAGSGPPPLIRIQECLEELSLHRIAPDSRMVVALIQALCASGQGARSIDALATCAQAVVTALTTLSPFYATSAEEEAAAAGASGGRRSTGSGSGSSSSSNSAAARPLGRPATLSEAWAAALDVTLSVESVCAAMAAVGAEGRPDLVTWLWRAYERGCEERGRLASQGRGRGAGGGAGSSSSTPLGLFSVPLLPGSSYTLSNLPPREAMAAHGRVVGALCLSLAMACTRLAAPAPHPQALWDTSSGSGSGSGSRAPYLSPNPLTSSPTVLSEAAAGGEAEGIMATAIKGLVDGWGGATWGPEGVDLGVPQPPPVPSSTLVGLAVLCRARGAKGASRSLLTALYAGLPEMATLVYARQEKRGGGGFSSASSGSGGGGGAFSNSPPLTPPPTSTYNDMESFVTMLWGSCYCGTGSHTRDILALAAAGGGVEEEGGGGTALSPASLVSASGPLPNVRATALCATLWYAGHASRGDPLCEETAAKAVRGTLGLIHHPSHSFWGGSEGEKWGATGANSSSSSSSSSALAKLDTSPALLAITDLNSPSLLPLARFLSSFTFPSSSSSSSSKGGVEASYIPGLPLDTFSLQSCAVRPHDSPATTPLSHLTANIRAAHLVARGQLGRAITEFLCPGVPPSSPTTTGAAASFNGSSSSSSGSVRYYFPGAPLSPPVFTPLPETLTLFLTALAMDAQEGGRSKGGVMIPGWCLTPPFPPEMLSSSSSSSAAAAAATPEGQAQGGVPVRLSKPLHYKSLLTRILHAAFTKGVHPRLADYAAVSEVHGVLGTPRLALSDIRRGVRMGDEGVVPSASASASASAGEGGGTYAYAAPPPPRSAVDVWGRGGACLLYASVLLGMARSGPGVLKREDVEWLGARASEDCVGRPRVPGVNSSSSSSSPLEGVEEAALFPAFFSAAVDAVEIALHREGGELGEATGMGAWESGTSSGTNGSGTLRGAEGFKGSFISSDYFVEEEAAVFSAAHVSKPSPWSAHAIFGTSHAGALGYHAALQAESDYSLAGLGDGGVEGGEGAAVVLVGGGGDGSSSFGREGAGYSNSGGSSSSSSSSGGGGGGGGEITTPPSPTSILVTLSSPFLTTLSPSKALAYTLGRITSLMVGGGSAVSMSQRLAGGRGCLPPMAVSALLSFVRSKGLSVGPPQYTLSSPASSSSSSARRLGTREEAVAAYPRTFFSSAAEIQKRVDADTRIEGNPAFSTLPFTGLVGGLEEHHDVQQREMALTTLENSTTSTGHPRLIPKGAWKTSKVSEMMPNAPRGALAAQSHVQRASNQSMAAATSPFTSSSTSSLLATTATPNNPSALWGTSSRPLSSLAAYEATLTPTPMLHASIAPTPYATDYYGAFRGTLYRPNLPNPSNTAIGPNSLGNNAAAFSAASTVSILHGGGGGGGGGGASSAERLPPVDPLAVEHLLAHGNPWSFSVCGHLPSGETGRLGLEAAATHIARATGGPSPYVVELPHLFQSLATPPPLTWAASAGGGGGGGEGEGGESAGAGAGPGSPLSEHTRTLESQLKTVHYELASLESTLLGLSSGLMVAESELCEVLSGGRDVLALFDRLSGRGGGNKENYMPLAGLLVGSVGGSSASASSFSSSRLATVTAVPRVGVGAGGEEDWTPSQPFTDSDRTKRERTRELLLLYRDTLNTVLEELMRECKQLALVFAPREGEEVFVSAAAAATAAAAALASSPSHLQPPPASAPLSRLLTGKSLDLLRRYESIESEHNATLWELHESIARDESSTVRMEDSVTMSRTALREWAMGQSGGSSSGGSGGGGSGTHQQNSDVGALLATLSCAGVSAGVRGLRAGRYAVKCAGEAVCARVTALECVLGYLLRVSEEATGVERGVVRVVQGALGECLSLGEEGDEGESVAARALPVLMRAAEETKGVHAKQLAAAAATATHIRHTMLREMGAGTTAPLLHLSTQLHLGGATPSSTASAAGLLAARTRMLEEAQAAGRHTAAAAGRAALELVRSEVATEVRDAWEEVNRLLIHRAHVRAGDYVMGWAAPADALEGVCAEAEDVAGRVRGMREELRCEEEELERLRAGGEEARGQWQEIMSTLDARDAGASAFSTLLRQQQEVQEREREQELQGLGQQQGGGGGGGGDGWGEGGAFVEELCTLLGECGASGCDAYDAIESLFSPLLPTPPPHNSPLFDATGPQGFKGFPTPLTLGLPLQLTPQECGDSLALVDSLLALHESQVGLVRVDNLTKARSTSSSQAGTQSLPPFTVHPGAFFPSSPAPSPSTLSMDVLHFQAQAAHANTATATTTTTTLSSPGAGGDSSRRRAGGGGVGNMWVESARLATGLPAPFSLASSSGSGGSGSNGEASTRGLLDPRIPPQQKSYLVQVPPEGQLSPGRVVPTKALDLPLREGRHTGGGGGLSTTSGMPSSLAYLELLAQ